MKATTITMNVYEVGDVIELKRENLRLVAKQRSYAESSRAVIISVNQRSDKLFTYKMIAENGKVLTLTPQEQGEETYIGHIDLDMLFGGGKQDDEGAGD